MSSRTSAWMVNATFCLTKSLYTVTVRGDKEENVVKSTCVRDRLEIILRKTEDFSIQRLTKYETFQAKPDRL